MQPPPSSGLPSPLGLNSLFPLAPQPPPLPQPLLPTLQHAPTSATPSSFNPFQLFLMDFAKSISEQLDTVERRMAIQQPPAQFIPALLGALQQQTAQPPLPSYNISGMPAAPSAPVISPIATAPLTTSPPAPPQPLKKSYTTLTEEQLEALNRVYAESQYVKAESRKRLAKGLDISDAKVRIWMSTKRRKVEDKSQLVKHRWEVHENPNIPQLIDEVLKDYAMAVKDVNRHGPIASSNTSPPL